MLLLNPELNMHVLLPIVLNQIAISKVNKFIITTLIIIILTTHINDMYHRLYMGWSPISGQTYLVCNTQRPFRECKFTTSVYNNLLLLTTHQICSSQTEKPGMGGDIGVLVEKRLICL